jgi:hypothetical protein
VIAICGWPRHAQHGRRGHEPHPKYRAELLGHANVDTTLNVYTQVLDGSLRAALETVGTELFTIDVITTSASQPPA